MRSPAATAARRTLVWISRFALVLGAVWCAAAIAIDGAALIGLWYAIFAAGGLASAAVLARAGRGRLGWCVLALEVLVVLWWWSIPPSQDRDWLAEVARLPVATIDGDSVTIRNIRNFHYNSETDFDENWETRSYRLSEVRGVDLFLSFWGPTMIAHTIVSWEFADGSHLAVSIETRKEKGEEYSAVLGFFRQFELYYVVADERDLVGLRTNHRGETVYLLRFGMTPEHARELLQDYLRSINELAREPRWYNALTHNCTTTIRTHTEAIGVAGAWDWRILANGHLAELAYERGVINTALPLEELLERSDVTERAKASGLGADFSERIRQGVPARPGSGLAAP